MTPVYHRAEAAYADYELECEEGRIFVHWTLKKRIQPDGPDRLATDTISYGRALTLGRARINAFKAMAEDAAPLLDDEELAGRHTEDGNELMRRVGKDPRDPGDPERRG